MECRRQGSTYVGAAEKNAGSKARVIWVGSHGTYLTLCYFVTHLSYQDRTRSLNNDTVPHKLYHSDFLCSSDVLVDSGRLRHS